MIFKEVYGGGKSSSIGSSFSGSGAVINSCGLTYIINREYQKDHNMLNNNYNFYKILMKIQKYIQHSKKRHLYLGFALPPFKIWPHRYIGYSGFCGFCINTMYN